MPNPFDADTIQPEDNNEVSITAEDLVGDGRKYRDMNELAKAYNHADAYIQQLKAKEAELAAEAKVLRDLVNARNEKGKTDDTTLSTARHDDNPPEQNERKNQDIDLNELVRKELSTAREEERAAQNINKAAEVMNNHFGSAAKAQEAVRRRAEELGVSVDWLRDSASKSPNAFFATMGINSNARPLSTPGHTPEVNLNTGSRSKRDMAFYEAIRKTDPKRYYSAETRKQLMEDARELGSSFFSTT